MLCSAFEKAIWNAEGKRKSDRKLNNAVILHNFLEIRDCIIFWNGFKGVLCPKIIEVNHLFEVLTTLTHVIQIWLQHKFALWYFISSFP